MKSTVSSERVTLAYLAQFDDILDVRSPSEYAEDHVPWARNFPVLNDEERSHIGEIHHQISLFEAKRRGAALIARNIARYLEGDFSDRPKHWKPLIYCWRGGNRSGAMAHILNQVGWRTETLEGGYKTYRRAVINQLGTLPHGMYFNIICGKTGSGKSRLLEALETQGAQVLDLEKLAAHRGSLLGDLPDAAQPPQKLFESLVWERLSRLDPGQPVYVEAESKKIGSLRVPDALIQKMWQSKCYVVEAAITQRVQFLKREYSHFLEDTQELQSKLELISRLHSHEVLNHWDRLAQNKQWDQLVQELLEKHYDPAYQRSILKHYGHHAERTLLRPENLEASGLNQLAADLSSSRN